jgi:alpha-beta hydrolase superfamily lysophospholipase
VDTNIADKDIVATICMVHGFAENSSISHFEGALMHAMNGFEVLMCDYKGFGFTSGPRGSGFKVQDSHEQIGAMLKKCRTDRPLFIQAHSMGCTNTQGFITKNPGLNISGLIYGAPFFEFYQPQRPNIFRRFLVLVLKAIGEVSADYP